MELKNYYTLQNTNWLIYNRRMLVVSVKGGNIEWAIKDYKKRVQSIKQIEELRERKNFTKPSKRKRLQREETIRKNRFNN